MNKLLLVVALSLSVVSQASQQVVVAQCANGTDWIISGVGQEVPANRLYVPFMYVKHYVVGGNSGDHSLRSNKVQVTRKREQAYRYPSFGAAVMQISSIAPGKNIIVPRGSLSQMTSEVPTGTSRYLKLSQQTLSGMQESNARGRGGNK